MLSATGTVNDDKTNITDINITVMKAAGSDNINLSEATIQLTSEKVVTLTGDVDSKKNDTQFALEAVPRKGDPPVLTEQSDRLIV